MKVSSQDIIFPGMITGTIHSKKMYCALFMYVCCVM